MYFDDLINDEQWKSIPKNLLDVETYEISDHGRVKNSRGRITIGGKPDPYRRVNISHPLDSNNTNNKKNIWCID